MISRHRRRETVSGPAAPSKSGPDVLAGMGYLHPTLRQGLFRYFSRAGRKRALVPYYSPLGVRAPLIDAGLELRGYPVGADLSLDPAGLKALVRDFRPDVFVYIHHFGLYLEENLRIVRETLGSGALLVENFAHSLPGADAPMVGDIALYSPWKLLGVADGAMFRFRDALPSDADEYGPGNALSRALLSRMEAALSLEDFIARRHPPIKLQTLAHRVLGNRVLPYPFLARHYRDISSVRISGPSLRVLESVDYGAVNRRRREIASLYLAGLEPRFRLNPSDDAYLRQSLVAFPVRVDDQKRFHAHLARRGVLGYELTGDWLLQPGEALPEVYRRHYLLPAGHHLEDAEIREVVACVNAYPG